MEDLTLQPRRWYAMDYYFPKDGKRHASPIWVTAVTPKRSGAGELALRFHHANYPEGVQDKKYDLKILRRTEGLILAARIYGSQPDSFVIITEITVEWVRLNWPHYEPKRDLQSWCDEAIGRPR